MIKKLNGQAQFMSTYSQGSSIQILAANSAESITLLDEHGKIVQTFETSAINPSEVSFGPQKVWIGIQNLDSSFELWNTIDHKKVLSVEQVSKYSVNSTGTQLATALQNGIIKLWGLDGHLYFTVDSSLRELDSLSFSADGKSFVATGCKQTTSDCEGTARIWQTDEGKEIATLGDHKGTLELALSPDSKHILTHGREEKTGQLWDMQGHLLKTFETDSDDHNSYNFSPDGQYIFTSGGKKDIKLWDSNGNLSRTFKNEWEAPQGFVANFSSDNTRLIRASCDEADKLGACRKSSVQIWGTEGSLQVTINLSGQLTSAKFSPDGRRIVTSDASGIINLWSAGGAKLATFDTHAIDGGASAEFSPDGSQILTINEEGWSQLWKVWNNINDMSTEAARRVGRSLTDAECKQFLGLDRCTDSTPR